MYQLYKWLNVFSVFQGIVLISENCYYLLISLNYTHTNTHTNMHALIHLFIYITTNLLPVINCRYITSNIYQYVFYIDLVIVLNDLILLSYIYIHVSGCVDSCVCVCVCVIFMGIVHGYLNLKLIVDVHSFALT